MKLDPRIYPAKRPLTCFDSEYAKQFEGKEGYFANSIDEFCNLKDVVDGKLFDVDDSTNIPFDCSDDYYYSFFLPKEWVKEPEKKWRPFSLTEWRHEYAIGDEIVFRLQDINTVRVLMYCGLFSDHDDDLPGRGVINLGGELFVLQNLFNLYELRENNEWQPFGVLVEGDKK